jgi:predicted nucleic acid-binding protein
MSITTSTERPGGLAGGEHSSRDLFVRYRERRVGWLDCASFAVMEELRLDRFLGFDDDFVPAGFMAYR